MAALSIGAVAHFLRVLGSVILSFGLIALGIVCLVNPEFASIMYGLPVGSASGDMRWVLVAGLRDFGLGVAALALHVFDPGAMRIFAPSLLIIPIGDAILTLQQGGTQLHAAIHVAGSVAIGILSACTFLDPTLRSARAKQS